MLKNLLEQLRKNSPIWLIALGTFTWSTTMVKSGLNYSFGIGFWGPNGHDAVWHLALINHLASSSFQMPTFAGAEIQNYHIGFDLFLTVLHKITQIPSHILYFQIFPPLAAVAVGILTYKLVLTWKGKNAAAWSLFFVYFGGSFGWIVTLIRSREIGGESLFWAQQAVSTLINPPFALSLVLLSVTLILLQKYEETPSGGGLAKLKVAIPLILVLAILPQIKVYAGVLAFAGFGAVAFFKVFQKRFEYILLLLTSSLLSLLLFFPLNKGSQNLVVFQPFWFLESMMAVSDRFYWPKFHEAMVNYKWGGVYVKALLAYGFAFLLFFVGNLGARMVGLLKVWQNKNSSTGVFLATVAVFGTVLPMLFLQKGTPWNTIQFFYYTLFVASIFAGIWAGSLWESKNKYKKLILTGIILITLPTTWATLRHYLPSRPPAMIPTQELEALDFLSRQEKGVVLTYPYDSYLAEQAKTNPPRPLYLYESTAYVAAFSKKPVFLEDEVNLNITGYEWKMRREEVLVWLDTLDIEYAYNFLRDNNISYIYWVAKQRARVGEGQWGGTQIFDNGTVKIYKVE